MQPADARSYFHEQQVFFFIEYKCSLYLQVAEISKPTLQQRGFSVFLV